MAFKSQISGISDHFRALNQKKIDIIRLFTLWIHFDLLLPKQPFPLSQFAIKAVVDWIRYPYCPCLGKDGTPQPPCRTNFLGLIGRLTQSSLLFPFCSFYRQPANSKSNPLWVRCVKSWFIIEMDDHKAWMKLSNGKASLSPQCGVWICFPMWKSLAFVFEKTIPHFFCPSFSPWAIFSAAQRNIFSHLLERNLRN